MLKRNFCWLLFILSIIVGIPSCILIGLSYVEDDDLMNANTPYIAKISIGNWYTLTFSSVSRFQLYSDIVKYLNVAGIIYTLIHSIYLRRILLKEEAVCDENSFTPSDYAIYARHLEKDLTK